ncbi:MULTISPECIES: hypothetical protein [unclassified Mesorhizobium]|uniref:hypothetical protein n=1 Tax=unclassified Mesorhizobium TaxID=325217 RepID=UPI0013E3D9F3|nr:MULTISPECIES: hypothetical protein [unclassified Mesorhizobium]
MSFSLPGHREQLYALSRSGGEVTVSTVGDMQMNATLPDCHGSRPGKLPDKSLRALART